MFPTKCCYVVHLHNIRVSHKEMLKFKCPLPALKRKLESVKEEAAVTLFNVHKRRTRTEKSENCSQDNRSPTKVLNRDNANKHECPPFGHELR
jgi:hypothetical protein